MLHKTVMTGKLVRLRPLEERSGEWMAEMRNLPDNFAGSYQTWPISVTEQDMWYDKYVRDKTQRRFHVCRLLPVNWEEDPLAESVGWIGLTRIDHKDQCAELGVRILPEHQRKGYGTEAVKLLTDWCFRQANLHRLYSEVFADNEPSLAFFRKLGWFQEGQKRLAHWKDGNWVDVVLFAAFRPLSEAPKYPSYEDRMRKRLDQRPGKQGSIETSDSYVIASAAQVFSGNAPTFTAQQFHVPTKEEWDYLKEFTKG